MGLKARDYFPPVKYGAKWGADDYLQGPITKGDYHYVDGDIAASGNGSDWSEAFKTIGEAVTALSDDDIIFISPGTYSTTAVMTITEDNVKVIGASGMRSPANVGTNINNTGSDTMGVDGNSVEIANITFVGDESYWCLDIPADNDNDPSNVYVHNCYFYATQQGSVKGVSFGNRAGDAGNAVSGLLEDCFFFKCGTTAMMMDGSRAALRRSTFVVMHANTAAVDNPQSGSQRNSNEIVDNIFVAYGTANEQKGLVFSGASAPTVGTMWVDGNKFINFASATLACNRLDGYGGRNWFDDQFLTNANPPVATNWYA